MIVPSHPEVPTPSYSSGLRPVGSIASSVANKLISGLKGIVRGREDTLKLVITGLLADGHVLLEDYPGSGKTTLSKALGKLISPAATDREKHIVPFRRIQFTPDMLPGDVLGVTVFEPKTATFSFVHGPVFAHILLADELNRTGPKVQAAFLECMAEKQVTLDNVTHQLDELFFVIGTQNPLDIAGTYPLPIVQLDRFMLRIPMSYVTAEVEAEILREHSAIRSNANELKPVVSRDELLAARKAIREVHISEAVRSAIISIVQATRGNPALQFGASTRAALMVQDALRAWAAVQGRDHATDDDLKFILPFVLLHRLKFHPGAGEPKVALEALTRPHIERLVRSGAR